MDNEDIIYQETIFKEVQYLEKEELLSDFSTVEELFGYFKDLKNKKKEIEFIYLAYLWVTRNLLFKSNVLSDIEEIKLESVLKTRLASSKGFNILFSSILEYCSIQVINIKGLYKSIDHSFDNKSGSILVHEWTGVFYQGKYHLVDCVLG